jgi:hypothetical protein
MTTIDPTTTTAQLGMANGPGRPGRPDMATAMAPVADELGMTGDELRDALRAGSTLDQLASAKGVSHQDLVSAITKGLQDARPAGAPAGVDLSKMAEDIASGVRGPGHHGGHHHHAQRAASGAVDPSANLNALADLVGVDATALRDGLQQGTSLSDILSANGVDESQLAQKFLPGTVVDTYA